MRRLKMRKLEKFFREIITGCANKKGFSTGEYKIIICKNDEIFLEHTVIISLLIEPKGMISSVLDMCD